MQKKNEIDVDIILYGLLGTWGNLFLSHALITQSYKNFAKKIRKKLGCKA